MVEAGGAEPPSEKRYGPKTTCLSHSIWFAGRAWNAQDALPTSPINLAGKPRTEVRRPACCVTPRSAPAGDARGDGLRSGFLGSQSLLLFGISLFSTACTHV